MSAFTKNAGIEGALKYKINEETKIKPYIAIEAQETHYGSFEESGTELGLEIYGGSYLRSAARIGTGVEYEKEKWSAYAKAEGKYLLSGREPEIEAMFKGTQESFKSAGAREGNIAIGLAAGGEIKITNDFKIYANINYYGAQRYSNIYGKAGIRYMFGKAGLR
jgi:uncharacterized protein with beta-barrel porin domain